MNFQPEMKWASRLSAVLCLLVVSNVVAAQTVSSVVVSPTSLPALVFSTGTVTLSAPAGVGGAVVTLKSSKTFSATVPASVTVGAGASTATFQITTHYSTAQQVPVITATFNHTSQTANLTVRIPVMGTAAGGYLGDIQLGTHACLNFPQFGGYDGKGNLYVSDTNGDRIRRIAPNGTIYSAAGVGQLGYNGENIPANTTAMGYPKGLAVNTAGDFWYADPGNNRVRKVTASTKLVATVAGNGTRGYMGDGGLGTSAEVNQPTGATLDAAGNLFFSDSGNNVVREINAATGIITTIAGNGTAGFSGDGGSPTAAMLNNPKGLNFDSATGNLYIVDSSNYRVRVISGLGGTPVINTFAGNGSPATTGDGGSALAASIGVPRNVLISNGTVYLSQAGISRIRQINIATAIITPVAGSINGYDGEGNPPASAEFQAPTGMMLDAKGNLLIIDSGNDRVRKISTAASGINVSTTTVTTIAGGYVGDGGLPTNGCVNSPESISFDSAGNYLIADTGRVRSVNSTGTVISTLAGTGVFGYTGDNGPATLSTMTFPLGVVRDASGNAYIADNGNFAIRKVDTTGTITTFWTDPTALDLTTLTTDAAGLNIYSVDRGACVVRQITPSGVATVVAGVLNSCGYNSDGITATTAQLNHPNGIALDAAGNLYIGDATNNRVRMVTLATGLISTLAGTGPCSFTGDGGLATAATLCNPAGVAVDPVGRVFIADYTNFRVRVIENGIISTYAGTGIPGYNNNGRKATLTNLGGPISVGLDKNNVMYVSDDVNYRVRVIQ